MTFELHDFLPSYPLTPFPDEDMALFDLYEGEDMYSILQRKKEFTELTLRLNDSIPKRGQFFKHQEFVRRFLSGHTPYDKLLLWHEVGTGKTLTAIAVVEAMKAFTDEPALILVKGQAVLDNFQNEIADHIEEYSRGAKDKEGRANPVRVQAAIRKSYQLSTWRTFLTHELHRRLYTPDGRRNEEGRLELVRLYSHRVIIIDEVHNLQPKPFKVGKEDLYHDLYEFLHLVNGCKILLMTATPMRNSINDFASIMNLLLPVNPTERFPDHRFYPQDASIATTYFQGNQWLSDEAQEQFVRKIKGYVSYLRQAETNVTVENMGEIVPGIDGFTLVKLEMRKEQNEEYVKAYASDIKKQGRQVIIESEDDTVEESGLNERSTQAILCTFPTYQGRTYGSKKIEEEDVTMEEAGKPEADEVAIRKLILTSETYNKASDQEKINQIQKYSIKYAYLLQLMLNSAGSGKVFAFCDKLAGSGLYVLSEFVKQIGYEALVIPAELKRAIRQNKKSFALSPQLLPPRKRFVLIESDDADDVNDYLAIYNHIDNVNGKFLQVILGSAVMGESRSLTAVRDIVILSSWWNYTQTEQAIGRGIRSLSHAQLPVEQRTVRVHRLMAYPQHDSESLDFKRFQLSYNKDVQIKHLEAVARDTAVDCVAFRVRNERPWGVSDAIRGIQQVRDTPEDQQPEASTFQQAQESKRSLYELRQQQKRKNGSRECLYQDCTYKCLVEPTDAAPELVDTYNLYYTESHYIRVCSLLQQYIYRHVGRYRTTIPLEELLAFITKHADPPLPYHVICRCLSESEQRNQTFRNAYGNVVFLQSKANILRMTYHSDPVPSEPEPVWLKLSASYPTLTKVEADQYVYTTELSEITSIMEKLKSGSNAVWKVLSRPVKKLIADAITQRPDKKEEWRGIVERLIQENMLVQEADRLTVTETVERSAMNFRQVYHFLEAHPNILFYMVTDSVDAKDSTIFDLYPMESIKDPIQGTDEDQQQVRRTKLTDAKRKGKKCGSYQITELGQFYRYMYGKEQDGGLSKELLCNALKKQTWQNRVIHKAADLPETIGSDPQSLLLSTDLHKALIEWRTNGFLSEEKEQERIENELKRKYVSAARGTRA